ncbi:Uncharacterised protein [Vibrio cholerae]|nr:Uncharacterised protein [Vibrio cholerae]
MPLKICSGPVAKAVSIILNAGRYMSVAIKPSMESAER